MIIYKIDISRLATKALKPFDENIKNKQHPTTEYDIFMNKSSILKKLKLNPQRLIIASVFFLCEFILFIYPIGWLKEDTSNFLSGEGAFTLDSHSFDNSYYQVFTPAHTTLDSIGLVFHTDSELADGSANISIITLNGQPLFSTQIPYSTISYDEFIEIPIDMKLSPFKSYYLFINCVTDSNGNAPLLYLCGPEYQLNENKELQIESEITSNQLVAKYSYKDAMDFSRIIKCLFIIFVTFLIIVIEFPSNSYFSYICSFLILLIAPYIVGQRYELLTLYGSFALPHALLGNMLLLYLFEAIIFLLTFSPKLALTISQFSIMLVYSVNFFVFQFRGTPFRINDILATGTAAQVLKYYDLTPNTHLAMNWCISIFFIVIGLRIKKTALSKKAFIPIHLISLICGVILFLCSKHILIETSFLTD